MTAPVKIWTDPDNDANEAVGTWFNAKGGAYGVSYIREDVVKELVEALKVCEAQSADAFRHLGIPVEQSLIVTTARAALKKVEGL